MPTPQQRLEAKFVKSNDPKGCWIWFGAQRGVGYGAIKINGRVIDAHRAAYEIYKGPVPKGALILHTCDNRACVNPDHLVIGDHSQNQRDAMNRAGVKPWRATRTTPLTSQEIAQIHSDYAGGVSERQLTRKYNVAATSLKRLLAKQKRGE